MGQKPAEERLAFLKMYRLVWEDGPILDGIPCKKTPPKEVDYARELVPRPHRHRVSLAALSLTTLLEEVGTLLSVF